MLVPGDFHAGRAAVVKTLLLIAVIVSPVSHADKTDLVHLRNGDRVTGEIEELTRGQVRLSTNSFGTIFVKWEDVERIDTNKFLQVELVDGGRYFGPAIPADTAETLALEVSGSFVSLDLDRIVYLHPIKRNERFQGNLDSSLAIGFSFTSASDVLRWNVNASTKYRTAKFLASASYDSLITNSKSGADSVNRDLSLGYNHFLRNRWLWFGHGNFQENTELGIDGRVLAGGGIGRYVSRSVSHEFLLAAGITGNYENSSRSEVSGGDSGTTVEGLLVADWSYFKLYSPKSDVSATLYLYPGISDSDRQRGDLRIRYRQEFAKDLFWNLTYFDTFDTKPPAGALSKRDYGLVTGVEYEF